MYQLNTTYILHTTYYILHTSIIFLTWYLLVSQYGTGTVVSQHFLKNNTSNINTVPLRTYIYYSKPHNIVSIYLSRSSSFRTYVR